MRSLLTGLVVAVTTAIVPMVAMADNQDTANEIAQNLRDSGKLSDYKIGVKFQDGTAWLNGEVRSQKQMNSALKLVFETAGVTRVVNNLKVVAAEPKAIEKREVGGGALAPDRTGLANVQKVPSSIEQAPARNVSATAPVGVQPTGRPLPVAYTQPVMEMGEGEVVEGTVSGAPLPAYVPGVGGGVAPMRCDQPHMPNYAWPSYAAYPNYGALTYPRQYSPTAWPFIGPFYPYPQVPLGWRKVTLEWDDGWWMLDFKD